ncbi:MAG TPA: AAA family ATPase [Candidatus Limnocylindrales bacterium]|nr:AAA family ATPase [Candidatus Limnocylindrales bacterium]
MTERRFRTRGQPAAVGALEAMLASQVPHALLLVGPPGSGKTTLALDLAAALLCRASDPSARPCRECRACRAVAHGNHPDLHRLGPSGAGAVIPIGGRDERGVRDLAGELALLPVEGGARVAIVEAAHRMTEDAQSALLKTLEEPPSATTLILCADEEERLLPTIRSRCVRLRLGAVGARDIEAILADHGAADAAAAARAARLATGRPGVALAYAAAPHAAVIRGEMARTLLDLRSASRTDRLAGIRDLAARAGELLRELDSGARRAAQSDSNQASPIEAGSTQPPAAPRGPARATADPEADEPAEGRGAPRVPAAERRAAAIALVAVWRDVLRDLAAVTLDDRRLVRDLDLLDDLEAAAATISPGEVATGLRRLDVAGERLEGNVSPELVLDVLALQYGR